MKRFLLAGLLMMGICQTASYAQSRSQDSYEDDIYYNSKDAKKNTRQDSRNNDQADQQSNTQVQPGYDTYSSSGNGNSDGDNTNYAQSYNSDGDVYIDYDDDNYTTRIQRFGYPSYSGYYDPFWFDPFYSPYYSYGWGYRPGFSIGFGGPYWSSYWGYSSWYGYPGFYSAWNYPYYACGWGGGYYGGYGNGYYDGYYSGVYNNNRPAPTYGPRTSMNGPTYPQRSAMKVRDALAPNNNFTSNNSVLRGGRDNMRMSPAQNTMGNASNSRPDQMRSNRDANNMQDGRRNAFQRSDRMMNNNAGIEQQAQQESRRARWFGSMRNNTTEMSQPSRGFNNESSNPGRSQNYQQSQPQRQSQPSYEQRSFSSPSRSSSPSYSSPSRSSGSFSSPGRSGGSGGFSGGRR